MKKNIRMILAATLLLMCGNVLATDVTLPAGTYYFDFTGLDIKEVEVFNNASSSAVSFDGSNPLNDGITQASYKQYQKSGMTYLVLTLTNDVTISDSNDFMHYQNTSNVWSSWWKWSNANLTDLGTNEYLCKVTESGFAWQTSGSIPSTTPRLTIAAAANGTLGTCTAGGSTISGTKEIAAGTSVHLIANPNDDYSFYGWVRADGSVASTLADYVFSMPSSSLSLTATFYADNTDPSISGCEGCFKVAP